MINNNNNKKDSGDDVSLGLFQVFQNFSFFLLGFPSNEIHESQGTRERKWLTLSLFFYCHPPHEHLDISRLITAERTLCV